MQPNRELLPDTDLGEYRLIELIAPQTWRARHLVTPREVCLRILARSTASDPARREEILSRIRSAAGVSHPAFPVVRNVTIADGWIVMTTDPPAGVPFDRWLDGRRLSTSEWGRFAWQLFSALEALHANGVIHGSIDGTTVRVDEGDNVRIEGLTFAALMGRNERGDAEVLAGDLTPAQLAHRSPEALAGQPLDARADLFSAGVLLYRAVTGQSPFDAATHEEVVQRVTNANPRNPREIDPDIPVPALTVVGRSLFKKPGSRYPDVKAVFADLRMLDPGLESAAAYPRERRPAAPITSEVRSETTNILVADIAFWEMLQQRDPDAASRAASRMQQFLGESVYLYEGEVIDSLGHRFIGTVPDATGAVTAAYRSLDELAGSAQSGDVFEPRILLLHGEIERDGAALRGKGLERALEALASLSPGQCLASGDVLERAHMQPSDPAAGTVGDTTFYPLPARISEKVAPLADESTPPAMPPAGDDTIRVAAPTPKPRRALVLGIAAAVVLLIGVAALAFVVSRMRENAPAPAPSVATRSDASAERFVAVVIPAEGAMPDDTRNVASMAAAAMSRLFQGHPGVALVDASQADAERVTFVTPDVAPAAPVPSADTAGADAPEAVSSDAAESASQVAVQYDSKQSPAFRVVDPDEAITGMISWVASALGLSPAQVAPPAGAGEAFGRASLAMMQADANAAAASAAEVVEAAPQWIPGWMLALDANRERGDRAAMLEAARSIVRLQPDNARVHRLLAISAIEDGEPLAAIEHAGAVLRTAPNDPDALEIIGRYALAAGDDRRFEWAVSRLEQLPGASGSRRLHRGDPLAIRGDLDGAIDRYFEAEERTPENPALLFKIGRVAALRGSLETAQAELEKLRRLDPRVGAPLVEAFILAQRRDFQRVPELLETAQKNARWNDDVWTHTAEIWAKAGERRRVMESLERALARGEINAPLVLRQKPFFYIGYDERGTRIQNQIEQSSEAIRLALAEVEI